MKTPFTPHIPWFEYKRISYLLSVISTSVKKTLKKLVNLSKSIKIILFEGWEQTYNCGRDMSVFEQMGRLAEGMEEKGTVVS